jgi:hypothetical protein
MRNVTVTLDEETAAWARVQAAKRDMSLSRFIGELLQERRHDARAYEEAMQASLAEKPFNLKGPWKPYPTREELHDRPLLRRR